MALMIAVNEQGQGLYTPDAKLLILVKASISLLLGFLGIKVALRCCVNFVWRHTQS